MGHGTKWNFWLQAPEYLPVLRVLGTAAIDHVLEALRGPPQGDTQGRTKQVLDALLAAVWCEARRGVWLAAGGSPH